jgi:hypothetical protein
MKIMAKYAAPRRNPIMYRGSRRRPTFLREAFLSIREAAKSARESGEEGAVTPLP